MIRHQLTQREYLAITKKFYMSGGNISNMPFAKYIYELYKGTYHIDHAVTDTMSPLFYGYIEFESDKDLTWFLLKT